MKSSMGGELLRLGTESYEMGGPHLQPMAESNDLLHAESAARLADDSATAEHQLALLRDR